MESPSFSRDISGSYKISTIANKLIEEVEFLSSDHKKDLIDGIITVLFYLLAHTRAWIRKCPARLSSKDKFKKCEKIFVCRDKRKVYCSNRCSTRVRMIEIREGESKEQKAAKNKARLIRETTSTKSVKKSNTKKDSFKRKSVHS